MTPDEYVALPDEEREAYLGSLSANELLLLGREIYNAGHYWHAHEAWEEVWLQSERPLRYFYQGLIQVAAAFVHLTRGEYPGTVKLLDEGIAKLELYLPARLGVDTARLVHEAGEVRRRAVELGERRLGEIEAVSLPRLHLVTEGVEPAG